MFPAKDPLPWERFWPEAWTVAGLVLPALPSLGSLTIGQLTFGVAPADPEEPVTTTIGIARAVLAGDFRPPDEWTDTKLPSTPAGSHRLRYGARASAEYLWRTLGNETGFTVFDIDVTWSAADSRHRVSGRSHAFLPLIARPRDEGLVRRGLRAASPRLVIGPLGTSGWDETGLTYLGVERDVTGEGDLLASLFARRLPSR